MKREDIDETERRQNEARDWVIRLAPGNVTVDDLEQFREWSALDAENARAFAEAHRVWKAMKPAGRNVFKRQGAPVRFAADRWLGRRAVLGGALTAAAAVVAYAAVRPPLDLWPSLVELLEADYRTGIGEQRKLALGSVALEMNTRTSVALRPRRGDVDRIELIAGEAMVTTSDNVFEIVAGPVRAEASDASFNIRHDGNWICVTCLRGEVKVTDRSAAAVSLGERQQVSFSGTGLGDVTSVNPAVITAWQSGALIFHDTPLSDVVAETNRYRHGRIIVANAELGSQLVNARFRLDRLDDVVTKLAGAFGATTTSLPGGVIVLR